MKERTVLDLFRNDVDAPRKRHYVHYFPGGERVFSTGELFRMTAGLAEGLASLGVRKGDRVMLLSENRPEWHMVDLATASLGAVDVPVYGTLTPPQIAYQVNDSGSTVAIVENAAQMDKYLQVRDACPNLKHLIQIEGDAERGVTKLSSVVDRGGKDGAEGRFWQRAAKAKPNDILTIIYTSGTTGEPKGVMLTHANLVENVLAAGPRVPVDDQDVALEFLPLCHVLERMLGYVYMWRATTRAYCSVYHVGELLQTIRPSVFAGVPRFYEKVQAKILEKVATGSAAQAAMFRWAIEVGTEASHRRIAGKPIDGALGVKHRLADNLVLSKVRAGLGGSVRYCISGGAALPQHVNEFFHAVGVLVMEGYGLTETSPVIAVNGPKPGFLRLGTVGKPLENLDLRLAPDGELLVRGPSVMKGYWNKPAQTAEVFDDEGFFHTGDIADFDDAGFLLITDRKKDLIVTAGGKNIAPQPIEAELKRSPLVENAVIVGDGRPYVIALFTPDADELRRWAAERDITFATLEALVRQENIVEAYRQVADAVNAGLARFEQIKKFAVLPVTLSVEAGHLTPTLKVKRRVVEEEFAQVIADLYRGEGD